jgi:hypothetical protein
MNPAVIAAFIAAGAALIAASISAYMASHSSRENWRREQLLPPVVELHKDAAEFAQLTAETRYARAAAIDALREDVDNDPRAAGDLGEAQSRMAENYHQARAVMTRMTTNRLYLVLLAHSGLIYAADELIQAHVDALSRAARVPIEPIEDDSKANADADFRIQLASRMLTSFTRWEVGADTDEDRPLVPWRRHPQWFRRWRRSTRKHPPTLPTS